MLNNKNIKSIAKAMVIFILLINVVTLSGCSSYEDKYIDMGYDYYLEGWAMINSSYCGFWNTYPMSLVALSKTNTFNKDNITFDIAYDTCTYNDEGFICYDYSYLGQKEKYFALYLCPYENEETRCLEPVMPYDYEVPETGKMITRLPSFEEIQNVKDHIFIKGISGERALTKDYAYSGKPIYYNHIESITIPWSYLKEFEHIGIIFACFYYEESPEIYNSSGYYIMYDVCVDISYKEIDENTIKLNFDKIT